MFNGLGFPKTMPFTRVDVVHMRHSPLSQRFHNLVRLEARHHHVIFALKDGNWILLSEGSCIGHKRIEIIDPITVSKVKLEILESIAKPKIKYFVAY